MKLIVPLCESLEDDLINEKHEIDQLTNELFDLFEQANFKVNKTINGVNFENKLNDVYVSFYVDDKLDYKGYVTNNDFTDANYTVKGERDSVITGAIKIINIFRSEV